MTSQFKFEELMKQRHSCRRFLSKPIPQNLLKQILSTSLLTPSWANSQPWKIYVLTGNALEEVRKIWVTKSSEKIKGYSDIPTGHRTDFCERAQKNMEENAKRVGEKINDPTLAYLFQANYELFSSPAVVYLTLQKGHTQWSVYDLGALGMSIMLAAKDLGIDSIVAYELVKYPDILRKYAKIPENENVIVGIALGYEDKDEKMNQFRSSRNSLEEVCKFVEDI